MGNGMLSQEEIDALLRGTLEPEPTGEDASAEAPVEISDLEKDAIGEVANISMGTAATTLSLLLGRKVEITTPRVDVVTSEQVRKDYPVPSVIVNVKYKAGIEGSNLLILSQRDGAVIVDLMMGGEGTNPSPELSELQISGIAEAMNQMMGSAATSMSTMFNSLVDITPPRLILHDLSEEQDVLQDVLQAVEPFVRISFRMVVESVIDSILVQVIPLSVAKGMVDKLMGSVKSPAPVAAALEPKGTLPQASLNLSQGQAGYPPVSDPGYPGGQGAVRAYSSPQPKPAYNPAYNPVGSLPYVTSPGGPHAQDYGAPPPAPGWEIPPQGSGVWTSSSPQGIPPYGTPTGGGGYMPPTGSTSVQSAQFAPLQPGQGITQPNNLGLILDVPLQVSVELGKAKKTIKEILEMGPGSVVELDRLAGEPVDMIVNGKLIAKCEVVVINETFGIRITNIVHPAERMQSLT